MNPGYLSSIIICAAMILLVCGWKTELIPDVSGKTITVFFLGWFLFAFLQMSVAPLVVLIVFVVIRAKSISFLAHLLSHGLLIASVYGFIRGLSWVDPRFVFYRSDADAALIAGLIAAVAFARPLQQLAAVSFGLVGGQLFLMWLYPSYVGFTWGDAAFQDLWWLAVALARFLSITADYSRRSWNQVKHLWRWR